MPAEHCHYLHGRAYQVESPPILASPALPSQSRQSDAVLLLAILLLSRHCLPRQTRTSRTEKTPRPATRCLPCRPLQMRCRAEPNRAQPSNFLAAPAPPGSSSPRHGVPGSTSPPMLIRPLPTPIPNDPQPDDPRLACRAKPVQSLTITTSPHQSTTARPCTPDLPILAL